MCPKYLQSFTKFCVAVKRSCTVHKYYLQYIGKNSKIKRVEIPPKIMKFEFYGIKYMYAHLL